MVSGVLSLSDFIPRALNTPGRWRVCGAGCDPHTDCPPSCPLLFPDVDDQIQQNVLLVIDITFNENYYICYLLLLK